jgi:hypothetical protein
MTQPPPGRPCPLLLRFCAAVAMLGCVALLAGNIVGSLVVPGHDWVADTVSDLAAGRSESIQDIALYGYAAALLAAAIGAAHMHLDGRRWSLGVLSLALLGCLVTIIAARDEYGDGDSDGMVVHIYLVYALGALFVAGPLLMRRGMTQAGRWAGRCALFVGGFWIVGAPIFFLLPTAYDGAWERLLGLVSMIWLLALATLFLRRAGAAEAEG